MPHTGITKFDILLVHDLAPSSTESLLHLSTTTGLR